MLHPKQYNKLLAGAQEAVRQGFALAPTSFGISKSLEDNNLFEFAKENPSGCIVGAYCYGVNRRSFKLNQHEQHEYLGEFVRRELQINSELFTKMFGSFDAGFKEQGFNDKLHIKELYDIGVAAKQGKILELPMKEEE